jgi:hypothetical protein
VRWHVRRLLLLCEVVNPTHACRKPLRRIVWMTFEELDVGVVSCFARYVAS